MKLLIISLALFICLSFSGQAAHNNKNHYTASKVAGHYEYVYKKIWVPSSTRRVWIPARFSWRTDSCGRSYRVCVSHGRYYRKRVAGYYRTQKVKIWVETPVHVDHHEIHQIHKKKSRSRKNRVIYKHQRKNNSARVALHF